MTRDAWSGWHNAQLIGRLNTLPLQDLRIMLQKNGLTELAKDLSIYWEYSISKSAFDNGLHIQEFIEQVLGCGVTPVMAEDWFANMATQSPATAPTQTSTMAKVSNTYSYAVIYREGSEEMFFGPFANVDDANQALYARRAEFRCSVTQFTIVKIYPK